MFILKILLLLLIECCSLQLWAKDIVSISEKTLLNEHRLKVQYIKLGLPPIEVSQVRVLNSFSYDKTNDTVRDYSTLRWGLGLTAQLNDQNQFLVMNTISFSTTDPVPVVNGPSTFLTTLGIFSNKLDRNQTLSYGFIATDKSNNNRVYPVIGYKKLTEDEMWLFNLSFPQLKLTYFGLELTELALFVERDASRYFVTKNYFTNNQVKYIEQNFNSIGFSYRYKMTQQLNFDLQLAHLFLSQWRLLDTHLDSISNLDDYSHENYLSIGLSMSLPDSQLK